MSKDQAEEVLLSRTRAMIMMTEPIRISLQLCTETTYRRPINLQLEMETTVDVAADGVEALAKVLADSLVKALGKNDC